MSRIVIRAKDRENSIAFGLDKTTGWFFQLFGPDDKEGEEVLLIDKDSMFSSSFGQGELIDMIRKYAVVTNRVQGYIDYIAMDLDPGIR